MSALSYFSPRLCKNLGCAKAAPRLALRGVGWADVHVFLTKMKANSYKMFGKINFKLFYKMYFLFLFFLHLDVLFSIPGEGKIFFLVFDKEGGDGKMFVKMGYPGWGWGDTCARLGCRLPSHLHAPTRWKKIKKIGRLSFLQIPKLL